MKGDALKSKKVRRNSCAIIFVDLYNLRLYVDSIILNQVGYFLILPMAEACLRNSPLPGNLATGS